jgi:hypothetical protein
MPRKHLRDETFLIKRHPPQTKATSADLLRLPKSFTNLIQKFHEAIAIQVFAYLIEHKH